MPSARTYRARNVGSDNSRRIMKGTYILVIHITKNIRLKIGKLGPVTFRKGYYLYVGSALTSLEKRIERHISKKKKKRWHIDYLTSSKYTNVEAVITLVTQEKLECVISKTIEGLSRRYVPVEGFGNGDCRECISHLYYIRS